MTTRRSIPRTTSGSRIPTARPSGQAPGRALRPAEIVVLLAVALILAGASFLPTPADGSPARTSARAVRVEASDSLWSIARDNPVEGETTAATVRRIQNLNGLRGADRLQVGTYVLVPRIDVGATALARR